KYAKHTLVECNSSDNLAENIFLVIKHSAIESPEYLGWNINNGGSTAFQIPVNKSCDEESYTNVNGRSSVWTSSETFDDLKFEFTETSPANITSYSVHANNYTTFNPFGGQPGQDGMWSSMVRAFWDKNQNNELDEAEDKSEWSRECIMGFDDEVPIVSNVSGASFLEGQEVSPFVVEVSDNLAIGEFCFAVSSPSSIIVEQSCEVIDNSSETKYIPSDFSGVLDTRKWSEGKWSVSYFVRDKAGNRTDGNDEADGEQNDVFSFTIDNVAPIISFHAKQPAIKEMENLELIGGFEDPSSLSENPDDGPWKATLNYSDGEIIDLGVFPSSQNFSIPSRIFQLDEDLDVSITLEVCEAETEPSEGECVSKTIETIIKNNAPQVIISADPSTSVKAGTVVKFIPTVHGGNPDFTYTWTGACNTTSKESLAPSIPGDHTCSLRVTDSDGDFTDGQITINVAAIGEGADSQSDEDSEESGDVLGEEDENQEETEEQQTQDQTNTTNNSSFPGNCTRQSTIGGSVFIDANENSLRDADEKGIFNVEIRISGNGFTTQTTKTNNTGEWTYSVCRNNGIYAISLDPNSFHKDLQLISGEKLSFNSNFNSTSDSLNFIIKDNSSENTAVVVVGIALSIILLSIGAYYVYNKRMNRA
ncbi:MAG TPA: SdrD B-like domain-containing protein, partial [Candidatus Dojkabacteria bacterium]